MRQIGGLVALVFGASCSTSGSHLARARAPNLAALEDVGDQHRRVFHASARLRASLDPINTHALLAPFATRVRFGRTIPGASAEVSALASPRALGPNPAPLAGPVATAPGTLGMVLAHNRELAFSVTDLVAPGVAMPLTFTRSLHGQDEYAGALGLGFSHNYEEQVVVASSASLIGGDALVEIDRGGTGDTVVRAGDAVLYSGDGAVVVFAGETPGARPSWVAGDPLLDRLAAANAGLRWFKGPPGVFDVLVRFGEQGSFLRVTPDGSEVRYDASGRLSSMKDRFGNHHVVDYAADGTLRRVRDVTLPPPSTSGESPTYELAFGYYRDSNDPLYAEGLDEPWLPAQGAARGHLARVRPDPARELRFEYDAAAPTMSASYELSRALPLADKQDMKRALQWEKGRLASLRGFAATGVVLLSFSLDAAGLGEVSAVDGPEGHTALASSAANTARDVASAPVEIVTADGTHTLYRFDAQALPIEVQVADTIGPAERTGLTHDAELRLRSVEHPRGNSVVYDYPGSALRRSLGNLREERMRAGTAGTGSDLFVTYSAYEPTYNLPLGSIDQAGREQQYVLGSGGRAIETVQYGAGLSGSLTHDSFGRPLVETSVDGTIREWVYSSVTGLPVTVREGAGAIEHFLAYTGCDAPSSSPPSFAAALLAQPCVVSTSGREPIHLGYDAAGRATSLRQGNYLEVSTYDRNGFLVRLERSTDGISGDATRVTTHEPDQIGVDLRTSELQLEVNGELSAVSTNAMGRIQSTTSPEGVITTFGYRRGRLRSVTDDLSTLTLDHDLNGNVTKRSLGGADEHLSYDGHDRLQEHTSPTGTRSNYTYSGAELASVELRDASGLLASQRVSDWDEVGRPRRFQDDLGAWTRTYGARTITTVSPEGLTATTQLDEAGRVVRAEQHGSSAAGAIDAVSTWTRDPTLIVASTSIDSRALSTRTVLDGFGRASALEDSAQVPVARQEYRADGALKSTSYGPGISAPVTTYGRSRLGELTGRQHGAGPQLIVWYDGERRLKAEGNGDGSLREYGYLGSRLETIIEPDDDSNTWTIAEVSPRGAPLSIQMPGGGLDTRTVDEEDRPRTRTQTFGGFTDVSSYAFDGLGRLTRLEARAPNASTWTATHNADGFSRETLTLGTGTYAVERTLRSDGAPASLRYPSGVTLKDERDPAGRLRRWVDETPTPDEVLATVTEYEAQGAPRRIALGNGVELQDEHDHRGQLVSRRYLKAGRRLPDTTYVYDDAGREVRRTERHLGGRVSAWEYDTEQRLRSAEVRRRPQTSASGTRTGGYARTYTYHPGTDSLSTIATSGRAPVFATSLGFPDALGHAPSVTVDGLLRARSKDALGNTIATRLTTGDAVLSYDGSSRLRRIIVDGTAIEYGYRGDGALLTRTATCSAAALANGCEDGTTTYVYSGLLLLEEWWQAPASSGSELRARYYYPDGSDVPLVADLRASAGAPLKRRFLVTDRLGSVTGVLDDQGDWVERVDYDPYGQAEYRERDSTPPAVSMVETSGAGLVVQFTEPVTPRTVGEVAPITGLRVFDALSHSELEGTWDYVEGGTPEDGVLIFVPTSAPSPGTGLEVTLDAGSFEDDWANPTAAATMSITWLGGPFVGPPVVAPQLSRRSFAGNHLAFQGHLADPDAGLILARARVLDPASGAFLSKDPSGFAPGSVNLYAALNNNPMLYRDPSGADPITLSTLAYFGLAAIALSWESDQSADLATPALAMVGGGLGLAGAQGLGVSGLGAFAVGGAIDGGFSGVAFTGLGDLKTGQLSSASTYAFNGVAGMGLGAAFGVGGYGVATGVGALGRALYRPRLLPNAGPMRALPPELEAVPRDDGAIPAELAEMVMGTGPRPPSMRLNLLPEAEAAGVGTYGQLRRAGAQDAHHVIQDAAVRDLPSYSRAAAPAVELPGPSTRVGSPHYEATQVQRQAGGGTYAAERRIGYKALRRGGLSPADARSAIERADDYFGSIGVTPATPTRVPGNR